MPSEIIRTAQFIDTFYPVIDGVVQTVHNYAKIMNKSSDCFVVCPDQKGNYDDSSLPYDVIRSASFKFPFINYAFALPKTPVVAKKVIARKPELIHCHSPFMLSSSAIKASKALNIPLVATFHSKYYDDFYQVTKSKTIARAVTNHIINFYNKCDSVWACSEGTAETLRSYGYKKDIFVCLNGSDIRVPDNIDELKDKAKKLFNLNPERRTILFVGSLVWQKNLRLILNTYRKLCDLAPSDYRLLIVGDGNHGNAIRSYAESLHFSREQLYFAGSIKDRELLSGIYAASDLFFFPSVYDNCPLVLREAAALGLPALLTAGSNSADVVRADDNGFVAMESIDSMCEKILYIFQNEKLRLQVAKKAQETIPISWDKVVDEVLNKYQSIVKQ